MQLAEKAMVLNPSSVIEKHFLKLLNPVLLEKI